MIKNVNKIRFRFGRNANRMLERKLVKNFIKYGKLTSTEKRIKFLKRSIEKMVTYAKKNTQATRDLINKKLHDKKIVDLLIKQVAPVFKDKTSGFVKTIKLNVRLSDGSKIARMEWSLPVVFESKKKEEKKPKEEKPTTKKTKSISKTKKVKEQVKSTKS